MLPALLNRLQIVFSSQSLRRKLWPVAPKLEDDHLRNCTVITDRVQMLETIPPNGACAELGILKGDFSRHILTTVTPSVLHLVDVDQKAIDTATRRFEKEIRTGKVVIHRSDSSEFLLSIGTGTLDWVYIDADHSYSGVRNDLEAAHRAIKPNGLISLNDYIFFGSSDLTKYGVIEATNEFCLRYDYEMISLALHGRMYNDVTIRRRGPASPSHSNKADVPGL